MVAIRRVKASQNLYGFIQHGLLANSYVLLYNVLSRGIKTSANIYIYIVTPEIHM